MTDPAPNQAMSQEEFFRWLPTQERKHELVDGQPVMMAGDNRRHDRIVTNALYSLGGQLRGSACQPFTADTAIRIPAGNIRYPDLGVDCGPFEDASMSAIEPVLVVEVLSQTTRTFDSNEKMEEYKTVSSLRYILLVDPDAPQVRLYGCDRNGQWTNRRVSGLEGAVEMPEIRVVLRLEDIYAGLEFRPRPRLVDPDEPGPTLTM